MRIHRSKIAKTPGNNDYTDFLKANLTELQILHLTNTDEALDLFKIFKIKNISKSSTTTEFPNSKKSTHKCLDNSI